MQFHRSKNGCKEMDVSDVSEKIAFLLTLIQIDDAVILIPNSTLAKHRPAVTAIFSSMALTTLICPMLLFLAFNGDYTAFI